jgi:hypothetical protein
MKGAINMAKKSDDGVTVESVEATLPTFEALYAEAALPFEDGKVLHRPGPGGRTLDYITGETAASRMQEVYKTYDWNVREMVNIDGAIIIHGLLSVKVGEAYVERSGIGSFQIGERGTNAAGAAKNAETNAFKRAASKFGVGLYLYEKDDGDIPTYSPPTNANFRQPVQFSQNNSTGEGTTGVIEQVSRPSVSPDGKQRLGGIKVNGQWYNVSSYTPIDLSGLREGQVVTVAHAPNKTFINGITPAGGAVAAGAPEEEEAF